MTDPRGLPGRRWYTNLLVAPAMSNGYAGKTLPGVREAIEQGQWQTAEEYARRTAAVLAACSEQLDRATAMLRPAD
jgi:N-acetylated-alpha-linked acidic dipeptidase